MKRGSIQHPKTLDLAARLGVHRAEAVGLLEACWHFASQYTPQGNIGKYPDTAIESYSLWEGEPGKFVAAMVEAKYFDKHSEFRLVIHDWRDHCDNAVQKYLSDHKLRFWDGCKPFSRSKIIAGRKVATQLQPGRNPVTTQSSSPMPLPLPLPLPIHAKPTEESSSSSPPANSRKAKSNGHGELTPELLIAMYNAEAPDECPAVEKITEGRIKVAKAALKQEGKPEFWKCVFGNMHKSDLLRGLKKSPGHENFIADFDWLMSKGKNDHVENYAKVFEGKYTDGEAA